MPLHSRRIGIDDYYQVNHDDDEQDPISPDPSIVHNDYDPSITKFVVYQTYRMNTLLTNVGRINYFHNIMEYIL